MDILVGLLPVLFLLVTVVLLLKKLTWMVIIAWVLQVAVALAYYNLSIVNSLISTFYSVATLWFVYYLLFIGIFLADLLVLSGAGKAFANHLYALESDKYVLATVLSGSLSSFLTSVGGGIGMALTMPITVNMLGMDPIIASAGMVTAFAWSMAYSGWGATATTLLIAEPALTPSAYSFWGSLLLIIPTMATQLIALRIYGGSLRRNAGPMTGVSAGALVGLLVGSQINFRMIGVVSSGVMLLGFLAYALWKGRLRGPAGRSKEVQVLTESAVSGSRVLGGLRSWSPVLVLLVIGTVWFYTPATSALESVVYLWRFPSAPPLIRSPIRFDPLGTQGTVVLLASAFAWFACRMKASDLKPLAKGAFVKWWPIALTTAMGAAVSAVFVQSGIGNLLAQSLAGLPGPLVAFLTPWLAVFAVLTVGGGAPTNLLLGSLAWNAFNGLGRTPALYTSIINMTGNGFAYSLSPAFVIGPVAIAGILGREGLVWRRVAGVVFLTVLLFSVEVLLLFLLGM